MGRSIPAHYCKVAILEKNSIMRGWSFPSEWLSSTHQSNTMIPDNMVPTAALNLIIGLPLVQDIWIYRWIDDDNLKAQLIDIKNILAERTEVEYYTDGSLMPSIPISVGKQNPNLVYTNIGAAFCVNNESTLSAQTYLSLWPSSTHAELVAIFLALLTEKKMDLDLAKVKRHSGDVMNEMVDELAKNTSNNSCYFNNRFSYSSRTVRFFPIFKQIPIEYNLRKFIKTLMNARVAAEWSMLKTNGHEIPITWNITWNLIHRYKRFNCISVKKHWHLIFIIKLFAKLLPIGTILLQRKPNIYKDFVCLRCNANKEENRYHFIECDANKDLWPIIKSRMQDDVIPIIQKWSNIPENTPKAIKLIWIPRCNATIAWEKTRNIGRKEKLNESENMDRYFKSSHQQAKHLKQDKQTLKMNNCSDLQEDQIVVLDDISIELDSVQSENSLNENYILSKCYRVKHLKQDKQTLKKNNYSDLQEDQIAVLDDISIELDSVQSENSLNKNHIISKCYKVGKKAQDQMSLLISNNWWYSWTYKKTKNIINNVIIELITT
ncbi:hypothetical protein RhiirC2_849474 [Rhizophagus irregularis]|uniref:RNase H type-1 domain-containing protein n=1 Tax=Rhizophagus irregularis TaxID=588596 RepID=A0A2N1NAS2_9GLOM|nr:hypothetical protein RhiirC2_849474 [Rhizophagus irregularis]